MMSEILKSASKLVLLGFSLTLVISVLFAVFTAKADYSLIMEVFKAAMLLVLGYYFGRAEKNLTTK